MKPILLFAFLLLAGISEAQPKDNRDKIKSALELADLNFTASEIDSMNENIGDYEAIYRAMHQFYHPNDVPYPFGFVPGPMGNLPPVLQNKIEWHIPDNVSLPDNRNDLAFYSIPHLASLLRSGKISSTELTKFFIGRLKKWGDTLECVISLTEDIAMQQAARADEELSAGIWRGPLHGIPYGLKDLFAVKGTKTTWGTTPYKDQVIDTDAYVYAKLQKAGAVLCAKLSLGSLAYDNRWFGGFTRNPWNLQQGSSGSSAGSAAATSAGLLPFAIGTETWGSIVSPSNRCGVTGLRPTFGRVSRYGGMVLCWSLDKIGPICRSAEDAAIVFDAIRGTDGKDPGAVNAAFNYNSNTDISQLRIAYAENYFKRLPENAAERKVIDVFRSLGAEPLPVTFPDSAIYPFQIMDIIISAECAAAFDELTRTDRDELIERQDKNFWPNIFRSARLIPAVEYINANRHRAILGSKLDSFMRNYDVVIVPSFAGNQLAITNLSGHPVVCMPIGFNERGLPLSITLIGNLYDEATILAAAKVYQDNTQHHQKHPPKFHN